MPETLKQLMTSVKSITGSLAFLLGRKGKEMEKHAYGSWKTQLMLAGLGIVIGALVGCLDTIFGKVLLWVSDIRTAHIFYLVPALPLVGVGIVWAYKKYGGRSGEGMGLILSVSHREDKEVPRRLIPFVMISTWLTHLFGGSAGREGVAVQLGATVSHQVGKRFSVEDGTHIFLLTGMAAGFAGLFRTPLAAIFFAMEVPVVGQLALRAILPMCTAAFTAASVSAFLGLEKFQVPLELQIAVTPVFVGKLIVIGLIFGCVGSLFAFLLGKSKKKFAEILPNPLLRVFLGGIILSILLLFFHQGRYTGLGTNLISASFDGDTIYAYDWLLKILLTVFTLSLGFQGGEVTPLFSIGASLGVILAGFMGLPVMLAAALGYAAVFGSATNTLLAPIFIGAEVYGYEYLPFFAVACLAAHIFCHFPSIYGKQKHGSYRKSLLQLVKGKEKSI